MADKVSRTITKLQSAKTVKKLADIEMMLNAFDIYWKETETVQPGIGGVVLADARWMLCHLKRLLK